MHDLSHCTTTPMHQCMFMFMCMFIVFINYETLIMQSKQRKIKTCYIDLGPKHVRNKQNKNENMHLNEIKSKTRNFGFLVWFCVCMLKHVYAESRGSCTNLHTQPCLETQQANPNQIYSKQPNMLSNQSNNKSKLHRKILKKKKKR